MDVVAPLQGMEMSKTTMSKRTKAMIVYVAIVGTLGYLYFSGTKPLVLLITGVVCLAAFNIVLRFQSQRVERGYPQRTLQFRMIEQRAALSGKPRGDQQRDGW